MTNYTGNQSPEIIRQEISKQIIPILIKRGVRMLEIAHIDLSNGAVNLSAFYLNQAMKHYFVAIDALETGHASHYHHLLDYYTELYPRSKVLQNIPLFAEPEAMRLIFYLDCFYYEMLFDSDFDYSEKLVRDCCELVEAVFLPLNWGFSLNTSCIEYNHSKKSE